MKRWERCGFWRYACFQAAKAPEKWQDILATINPLLSGGTREEMKYGMRKNCQREAPDQRQVQEEYHERLKRKSLQQEKKRNDARKLYMNI